MYKVIAIIGQSGSGKDTVLSRVLENYGNKFNKLIPFTTRPKRPNEIDGENYYFVSNKKEKEAIMVSEYNNWFYGYNKKDFLEDKINIGVFNLKQVEWMLSSENKIIDLIAIYRIVASDYTILARGLERDRANAAEMARRFIADKEEFSKINFPYFELINESGDLPHCAIAIGRPTYIK